MNCRIIQFKYTYSSFQKLNNYFNFNKTNLKKLFNFYFIFYFCSFFLKYFLKIFKKCKKKIVVLKSPFHFKVFKHHITYAFYNIKFIFYIWYKLFNFVKIILLNYFFLKKCQDVVLIKKKKLFFKNLIL